MYANVCCMPIYVTCLTPPYARFLFFIHLCSWTPVLSVAVWRNSHGTCCEHALICCSNPEFAVYCCKPLVLLSPIIRNRMVSGRDRQTDRLLADHSVTLIDQADCQGTFLPVFVGGVLKSEGWGGRVVISACFCNKMKVEWRLNCIYFFKLENCRWNSALPYT
jgi:hypothetical protein